MPVGPARPQEALALKQEIRQARPGLSLQTAPCPCRFQRQLEKNAMLTRSLGSSRPRPQGKAEHGGSTFFLLGVARVSGNFPKPVLARQEGHSDCPRLSAGFYVAVWHCCLSTATLQNVRASTKSKPQTRNIKTLDRREKHDAVGQRKDSADRNCVPKPEAPKTKPLGERQPHSKRYETINPQSEVRIPSGRVVSGSGKAIREATCKRTRLRGLSGLPEVSATLPTWATAHKAHFRAKHFSESQFANRKFESHLGCSKVCSVWPHFGAEQALCRDPGSLFLAFLIFKFYQRTDLLAWLTKRRDRYGVRIFG